jgi:acyl carrier protein
VELVVRLEGTFNVELKPEDLQDVRFKTIAGIAGIIEEKTGGSKA